MPNPKVTRANSGRMDKERENERAAHFDSDGSSLLAIHETLKIMDAKFTKRLDTIDKRFTDVFEQMKSEFGKLRDEIKEDNSEMNSRIDGIESSLEYHIESLETQEKAQSKALRDAELKLNIRINCLEESLLLHEKNSRKYNLLLYGIPVPGLNPTTDTTTPTLAQPPARDEAHAPPQVPAPATSTQTPDKREKPTENIYRTIKTFLKVDCKMVEARVNSIQFQHAHRLPNRRGRTGPEPIIVRFVSYMDRETVFEKGFSLPKGKRILSDLPVQMKKERNRLASEAYKIRQEEKLQTRIREAGLNMVLETRRNREDKWTIRTV